MYGCGHWLWVLDGMTSVDALTGAGRRSAVGLGRSRTLPSCPAKAWEKLDGGKRRLHVTAYICSMHPKITLSQTQVLISTLVLTGKLKFGGDLENSLQDRPGLVDIQVMFQLTQCEPELPWDPDPDRLIKR